ncbi:MAG: hypothetical protein QUS11_06680 [Candidatus Fermentibacter sp.]|nr:hypothetical protein [Candidatus Fermentibacter sp.]
MIEDHLGNGWMNVPAEAIGALTGCEDIISEDYTLDDDGEYVPCAPDPVLYWHADYMVEVPVELWSQGREVIFKRA